MSFILDALKKAEAERRVGSVPNVHAQSPVLPSAMPYAYSPWKKRVAAAVAIAATAGAAYLAFQRTTHKPVDPVTNPPTLARNTEHAAPAGAVAAPVVPGSDIRPEPREVRITSQLAGPLPAAPRPAAPKPAEKPAPKLKQETRPAVAARPQASTTASVPPVAPPAVKQPVASLPPATANPPASDIAARPPADAPQLAIGGYIYSENPSERQLLVNNRLLREGSEAAPGVILEKMMPKAAVFNYRGQRYQLAY